MQHLVEVTVAQGVLRGQRLSAPNGAGQFDAFLGVPYAKPPLGELRFKAPQPPEPWDGARPALEQSPFSLQHDFLIQSVVGGEDCLYLNVFSPQVPTSVRNPVEGSPWPTMVYFHPGGFINGNSSMRDHAPEHLVGRGVVLVNVTYRLGALGFLSFESETLPGNAGLKDAVAALRWVRDNISVFGGDANRVTVFGCSAGAAIAHYLQLAPSAKGLFHRAIMMSGVSVNPWTYHEHGRERALRLARLLGCDSHDDQELLSFLQKVPAKDILERAFDVVSPEEYEQGLIFPFLPCSEKGTEGSGEEMFITDHPLKLMMSGQFYPVPSIVSVCDVEGILTLLDASSTQGISARNLEAADNNLERVVPAILKLEKGSEESQEIADSVRKLYFNGGKVTRNSYFNLYSDLLFSYGAYLAARIHALHTTVYFCQFSVSARNNRFSAFLKCDDATGACHGDDVGYIFGRRPPLPPEPDWEPHSLEAITRKRLVTLYTNFAQTGNPIDNNNKELFEGINWSPLSATSKKYLDIGVNLLTPNEPFQDDRMKFWDSVYKRFSNIPEFQQMI